MIPEIIIKTLLDKIFKLVSDDYMAVRTVIPNTDPVQYDESKTLLYEILLGDETVRWGSDEVIDAYKVDIMKSAVEIFVNRGNSDSRKLKSTIMFSPDMISKPCIHITSPSESHIQRVISDDFNTYDESSGYRMVTDSTYTLLITSMNKLEVLITYYVMQAMLMSTIDTFVVKAGFTDWEVSGQELRLNNPSAGHEGLYAKGINLRNNRSLRIRTPKMINDRIKSIILGTLKVDDGSPDGVDIDLSEKSNT